MPISFKQLIESLNMNYKIFLFIIIYNLFTMTLLKSEEKKPRIKYLPISEYPSERINNNSRNTADFMGQWDVMAEYYPELFSLTAGQAQIVPNLYQLSGSDSLSNSAALYFGTDSTLLKYMHLNNSNYGRSYLFSNTPVTLKDKVYPFYGGLSNSFPIDTSLVNSYSGEFPRYLFYLSDGSGPFSSQSIIFIHWESQQNYHVYRNSYSMGHHGMGSHGVPLGEYFEKIDYLNKIVSFDSTQIKMSHLFSNNLENSGDSLDIILSGMLEPDSIDIVAGQTFELFDFLGLSPKMTNLDYNQNDSYTWHFNNDQQGHEVIKRISSWNSADGLFTVSDDSTSFTWLLNENKVAFNRQGGYGIIDSVSMQYSFVDDSLFLLGNKNICEDNSCANFNSFDIDYFKNFSGFNNIEFVSVDLGLFFSKIDTSIGNISIQNISGNNISTNLYPTEIINGSLEIYNLGPGNLEYEVTSPSASWILMNSMLDTLQPDSYRTISYTIDLSNYDIPYPSLHSYDVIINSNDNTNSIVTIPFNVNIIEPTIEVPDLWGFTIDEDDSLTTNYYLYGYIAGLSSSISVNTNFVHVETEQVGETNSFQLKAIPSTNWFGSCSIKVIHQNEFGYSDSSSLRLTVNPMIDPTIGPVMLYPTDSLIIQFADINDSIGFSWIDSKYLNSDIGPGFNYELFVTQTSGDNITNFHFENIQDTSFVFSPDTLNLMNGMQRISWTLKTYEQNNSEILHSRFGQFFITMYELGILDNNIPNEFSLYQNYPNPFNPTTRIQYNLPEKEFVNIDIFDLRGNKVRSLLNTSIDAGYRSIIWDATNDLGQSVSAGMYIYTIQAGSFRKTKKMILLK